MLVLRPVGAGQIGYYLPGPEPGRWTGTGSSRLGLDGEVDAKSLGAVLGGCQPDGTLLLRRLPARRRCGFDAILAAPKSVSLLAAMADAEPRSRIELAHHQAVAAALSYLERHATWTRRGGEQMATDGLIAASFTHRWSAAGDPHLHTHLVVANLARGDDGVWSTLDSRALYRHARAAGAIYQVSLRHQTAERGLHFGWAVRRSGLADIAGVPRAAIDTCSRRQRQVTDEVESGSAGRRGRATAGGRTRAAPVPGGDERWDVRTAETGFGRAAAAGIVALAVRAQPPQRDSAPAGNAIEAVLGEQHSRFERQDVIHAITGLTVAGAGAEQVERWADDFLSGAVALDRRTWTTAGLRRTEEDTIAMATRTGSPKAGVARASTVDAALAQRGYLTGSDEAALRRLTTGGAPVELLGAGSLVSQAWVLDAAREAWDASGHRVAVVSLTERGSARWQALAGIGPPPPPPAHPTVLIVDGVDRWPTSALHRVLADGEARNAKVVLVDGGTNPARHKPVSAAVETLRNRLPAIDCGVHAPDPARLPGSGPVVRAGRDQVVAVVPSGPAAMAQLVSDWAEARSRLARDGPAAEAAVRDLPAGVAHPAVRDAPTGPSGPSGPSGQSGQSGPTMVAMGPEEAAFLNAAARSRLQADGRLSGPAIEAGGRQYQAGDELRALRRDRRLGSVPGGTVGVVKSVDESRRQLVVQWPGHQVELTARQLAGAPLTHAYATTPAYVRGETSGITLALGDTHPVAPRLTPDAIVHVLGSVPTRDRGEPVVAAVEPLARLCEERDGLAQPRHAGASGEWGEQERWEQLNSAIHWRENALGQAADVRPSRAVLEELGPRPAAGGAEQQAWRQAAQAIEVYRDRWSLPDRRLDLAALARSPAQPGRQLADAVGVITGCQRLEQARDRDHALTR